MGKSKPVPGRKTGRPTRYSQEVADILCAALMDGYSLRKACALPNMPHLSTITDWLLRADHPFSAQYARAREIQAERLVDDLIDIADNDSRDVSGELKMPNSVAVQRDRLKVDTRKWIAVKLLPKKYGDRLLSEHTGKDGAPLTFTLVREGAEAK